MPKEEWGTKRLCPTTGKRFYDLNKTPIVSPYTGEVVDIESVRRKITAAAASRPAAAKDDDDVVVDDDLDADDDLLAVAGADDSDDVDDDLLEDDSDDTVSLDDLADVSNPDDDS
ncbi:TIGR02300 family protein [Pseudorhodobacter ferrugineus]|uniref:TIGR02300 family protein n=1 Tax=Pseudorhodobacter ferrugineus TaxID=77008 RepID=UPI0003B4E50F|nr:TIGR02300 family protein [Pseudorhodobacter ferrugineus]